MNIIDGKQLAKRIIDDIKDQVDNLSIKPGLAVVLVGENPASKVYVNMKEVKCNEIGYYSQKSEFSADIKEEELLKKIEELNKDPKIHGILVQLPLPDHINENKVIEAIDPRKDVDGFHPISMGNLLIGKPGFISCTPKGVMKLIESTGVELSGKNAVVVGRSNIVGKPVAQLLLQKSATVTICHSRTQDLAKHTREADILVVAVGSPHLVKADMVKEGAIVIDVGTTKLENKKLVGDVDFENVKDKASYITPVPGGVGPMTIACLMENTLEAFEKLQITD